MEISKSRMALIASIVGMTTVIACQTYDFQPVTPFSISQVTKSRQVVSKRSKPNLMLVVDKSGSMSTAVGGKSRWVELQDAMSLFLTKSGTVARMGMMTFPTDGSCGAPSEVRIALANSDDEDKTLSEWADKIRQELLAIKVSTDGGFGPNLTGGGTPTAQTIRALGNYSGLNDANREDIILLLTDGLPNCNTVGKYSCAAQTCTCTSQSGCSNGGTCGVINGITGVACLDKDSVVEEIAALRARQIRTIVVGFGADIVTADAFGPLNAMAEAGGFALTCPNKTDAECGNNNKCDVATGTCTYRYYQAQNSSELSAALEKITNIITEPPCEFKLDEVPTNPDFISVLINGQSTLRGADTWNYANGKVTFVGTLCKRLETATSNSAVNVEIRFVQPI